MGTAGKAKMVMPPGE